jgi:hypothetical protein
MGMMVGLGLALYYHNEGPVIPKHVWEEDEEEDTEAITEVDAEEPPTRAEGNQQAVSGAR